MASSKLDLHCPNLEARFWPKVVRTGDDECWTWIAAKNRQGYGVIGLSMSKSTTLATHVALAIDGRVRPSAASFACHTCDNPCCVNPRHLWWGDAAENNRDMHGKGRWDREKPKGEKNWAHKLNEDQVRQILSGHENNAATAREYGVTATLIRKIRHGLLWSHLPRE